MWTPQVAREFATEWIAAWNSHDLDAIMQHYSDNFEMTSPGIVQIVGEVSGTLTGKATVRDYWKKALDANPDLHFDLVATLLAIDSITLYYIRKGQPVAEVFFFNSDYKVIKGIAHRAI